MKGGIYAITHSDGRAYIGSSVNILGRWACHVSILRTNKHHSPKLQRAWNKYGESAFIFSVIEVVELASDLIAREQFHIDCARSFAHGFNISPTAGNTLGRKHCDEAIKKMSAKATGRICSEQTRKKMSMSKMGKKASLEVRLKMSAAMRGKNTRKATDETKRKMSLARLGRPHSAEHRERLAVGNRARALLPVSKETRERMSLSAKRRLGRSRRNSDGTFGAENNVVWSEKAKP